MEIKISNQARTYLARVLKLTSQWALPNANSKGTQWPHARVLNCYKSRSEILNLRTELFRPLWTRQRSTDEMRPNLIAMEIKISNQARTYLARVLKLTSQWALPNANSKGTQWPHARVLNCYKSRSEILNLRTELFRPLWTRQRSTEEMRPNLIAMEIKISNQARTYLARVLSTNTYVFSTMVQEWNMYSVDKSGNT